MGAENGSLVYPVCFAKILCIVRSFLLALPALHSKEQSCSKAAENNCRNSYGRSGVSGFGSINSRTDRFDAFFCRLSNRVTVTGTANIILQSGTLTCKDGIRLSKGNTLNIFPGKSSEGTLEAKIKGDDYAIIGGNENETCGTLNYYGGTLNAKNKSVWTYAAAIGGGEKGGAGNLNFYGGKVTAINIGKASAKNVTGAAIGSGGYGSTQSIGHGDIGWYIPDYSDGSIVMTTESLVYAGSSKDETTLYAGNDRIKRD